MADRRPSGETADRLAAAHLTTASHVLVKVSVQNSTLLVAVDTLTPPGSRLDLIVPAAVQAVLSAVTMWHRVVVGEDPFADPLESPWATAEAKITPRRAVSTR